MHPSLWSWPQWIWVGLVVTRLLVHAAKNGEPIKDAKWNFAIQFMWALIIGGLLYWGGFLP